MGTRILLGGTAHPDLLLATSLSRRRVGRRSGDRRCSGRDWVVLGLRTAQSLTIPLMWSTADRLLGLYTASYIPDIRVKA